MVKGIISFNIQLEQNNFVNNRGPCLKHSSEVQHSANQINNVYMVFSNGQEFMV